MYHVPPLQITSLMKADNALFASVYPGPAVSGRERGFKYLLIKLTNAWRKESSDTQLCILTPLSYLFLAAVGLCCSVWALSSCSQRRLLAVAVHRLLLQSMGSRASGFRAAAFPWQVESSQTRDWICVLCIGRRILNPWTIREALLIPFKLLLPLRITCSVVIIFRPLK